MRQGLFRVSIASVLVFVTISILSAQRVIVNNNGDRIIMYPDGTWRTVEPGDSVLLRQNLQTSEVLGQSPDKIDHGQKRTKGEGEEYILRQWNEFHFRVREEVKKVQHDFRVATNAQFKAGELLQNAEENKSLVESDRLATLHEDYEKAIYNLHLAKLKQKAIIKFADTSKKMLGFPPSKIEKKLPQLRLKFENYLSMYEPGKSVPANTLPNPQVNEPEQIVSSSDKSGSKKAIRTSFARLPPQELPKPYKSEPFHCKVTTDTIDAVTGRRHIALEPALIFTHTDPDLRPYFKSKELITCYGRLYKINAYVYLTIEFQIASSHSQGNFGTLENGSLLSLKMLNGKYVSLYNLKTDRGRIDAYTGNTIFTGQYELGKKEMKMLSESSLDKIRILWSTGYEDYDVYKIDFFIDQINCLMSK